MEITALIPAYNEEDSIGQTIEALKSLDLINNIVVVDDGSTDKTAELAERVGAKLVRLRKNVGKGDALNTALSNPVLGSFDALLLIDGDVGETAREASKLIQPIMDGRADMTIAVFSQPSAIRHPPSAEKGGFGLVKGLARWGIKRVTGQVMETPLSGQRALRREVLTTLGRFAEGFGMEVALTIDALKAGFKVQEIPVNMSHNVTGRDIPGFLHRGRQFLSVLKVVLKR